MSACTHAHKGWVDGGWRCMGPCRQFVVRWDGKWITTKEAAARTPRTETSEPCPDCGHEWDAHMRGECRYVYNGDLRETCGCASTPRTETSEPELEELMEEQRQEDERNERLQSEMDSAGYWP